MKELFRPGENRGGGRGASKPERRVWIDSVRLSRRRGNIVNYVSASTTLKARKGTEQEGYTHARLHRMRDVKAGKEIDSRA